MVDLLRCAPILGVAAVIWPPPISRGFAFGLIAAIVEFCRHPSSKCKWVDSSEMQKIEVLTYSDDAANMYPDHSPAATRLAFVACHWLLSHVTAICGLEGEIH